jgi:hypothetical protein
MEQMAEASRWQDQVEAMNYVDGDQSVHDAGLPVG